MQASFCVAALHCRLRFWHRADSAGFLRLIRRTPTSLTTGTISPASGLETELPADTAAAVRAVIAGIAGLVTMFRP